MDNGNQPTPWADFGSSGSLALELVNTLDWRLRQPPVEKLRTFWDLVRWASTARVYGPQQAARARAWARAHPRAAARTLAACIVLREAIADVFQAVVQGGALPAEALATLDRAFRAAIRARRLVADRRDVDWQWRDDRSLPQRPAHRAALDAVRLLTSPDRALVRQCGDARCGWLFLDTSRNRSRRWCNMQGCGNRNKARRFYGRARGRVRQAANGKAARRDQAMDRAAPSTRKARAQH